MFNYYWELNEDRTEIYLVRKLTGVRCFGIAKDNTILMIANEDHSFTLPFLPSCTACSVEDWELPLLLMMNPAIEFEHTVFQLLDERVLAAYPYGDWFILGIDMYNVLRSEDSMALLNMDRDLWRTLVAEAVAMSESGHPDDDYTGDFIPFLENEFYRALQRL